MSYFVFDMDETLAELYSVYYFIASLKLKETVEQDDKISADLLPISLINTLTIAYKCFVQKVLKEELSARPLGVLRPGILGIMKKLAQLQRNGAIAHVIIYSNNGHLQSLEFIRDVIHEFVGTSDLIKDCIHWNHPMRATERSSKQGAANKTWPVLKNIMINGNCKAPQDLEPTDVYFFDDVDHKNLQNTLISQYYKVPAYTYRASFNRLEQIYRECLQQAKVNIRSFTDYVIEFFANNKDMERINLENGQTNIDAICSIFQHHTPDTNPATNTPPLTADNGIYLMKEAIITAEMVHTLLQNQDGGAKKRRRQHKAQSKKRAKSLRNSRHKKLKEFESYDK